jgi:thymidine kinase
MAGRKRPGTVEPGRIEVISGPMFSGKSTELLRRLTLARIARRRTCAFKHQADRRYGEDAIATHAEQRGWAIAVASPAEIVESWHARSAAVVGIDEAQFFDASLVEAVEALAERGKRVIVAGLNQDSFGRPFGPMPELMARADHLFLCAAVCVVCGREATKTFRKSAEERSQVLIGAEEEYEARCRQCWSAGREGE